MLTALGTRRPSTLGMSTIGGPGEISIVMTSPLVNALPGATDCLTTVLTGWSLCAAGTSFSFTPLAPAHCSATDLSWPTKLGSGGPALSTMDTGLGCGQDVPAVGSVEMTIPTAIVVDVTVLTFPGTRPACLIAACASLSGCPVTCGMSIMCGPADTTRPTRPPRAIRDPFAGLVRMTRPLATVLSSTVVVAPG